MGLAAFPTLPTQPLGERENSIFTRDGSVGSNTWGRHTLDGVCTRCCAALFVPFAAFTSWRAGRGYMKLEKNFLSPKPNFPIFRWAPGGPGSGGCKVTHTPPTPNPIGAEPMSVVLCVCASSWKIRSQANAYLNRNRGSRVLHTASGV